MEALLPMIVFKVPVECKVLIRCSRRLTADGTCFHQYLLRLINIYRQLFNNMASLLDIVMMIFPLPLGS